MTLRKSFILHIDSLQILDELSDEQAGQLFKLIAEYHNPEKPKITQKTQVVNLAFHFFKTQFDRDLQKYEDIVKRNKFNGMSGGRPKKETQNNPKKPDSKNKNDSDSKNESKKDSLSDTKKDNSVEIQIFNEFRVLYQGTKRGLQTEFDVFKKHKDWKEVLPKLKSALNSQIQSRNLKKSKNEFVPEWKNLKTWINNRCWEETTGNLQKSNYSHLPLID